MLEAALLCLGSFAAGCCSSWAGKLFKRRVRGWNRSLSAARKGRMLSPRRADMSPTSPRSPSKATSAVESRATQQQDRDAGNLWRKARYVFGNMLTPPREKPSKQVAFVGPDRQVEVKMFPFHAGARIGEHSFVQAVMLKWISDVVHRSFLRRDVKLNADSLTVVEAHRRIQEQSSDGWHLSQQANEHFAHSTTRCEIVTDPLVPLPLSQVANEHWLFHGNLGWVRGWTSSNNVVSIFEEGFQDKPHLTHGAAFGSGIYFTECSSKADMYTVPAEHREAVHDHGGLCCMLLCRVTLGRARKLDSEFHVDKNQLQEVARSATPVPNLRQSYLPQQRAPAQAAAAHVPCYHAEKLRQQLQAKQQAIRVMEPFRKVNGEWVDYWSEYHQCWIPASILDVDPESGGIVLDVKPGTALRLHDQWRVRPRRMPTPDQAGTVGKVHGDMEFLKQEIQNLIQLDHPHVAAPSGCDSRQRVSWDGPGWTIKVPKFKAES
eukprot:Skav216759  [mRNA]  locus=scaffold3303:41070:54670:- [translate_table: standard]